MLEDKFGVWWDINTCPVPDGIDLASVRSRIELPLITRFGENQYTIFCVGNLERIAPQVLKELSSSGILLRHVPPFGWATLSDHMREWKKRYPLECCVMLISGDISWFTGPWFNSSILSLGYTILRAFPAPRPPGYPCLQEWVWEELLLEREFELLPNSHILPPPPNDDEPASFCTLCEFSSPSCDEFIHHLKSNEHMLEFTNSVLAFVDENSDVINHCKLLDYSGLDPTGGDLSQNVSCLSDRAFNNRGLVERPNIPLGLNKTTTGVWWDINSCPIPEGYDPGSVRSRIESSLQEYLGPDCPVTIFCVGNLEYISPRVLKELSASGILLRHDMDRGMGVLCLLREWEKLNPPPAKIMLISGDETWFNCSFFSLGYTLLRAFPPNSWPFVPCTYTHSWAWDSLLEKDSSSLVDKNSPKDDPDSWFCTLCKIPSESCEDFINHLKGTSHSQELWSWIPVDKDLKPCIFCEICEYPGYDDHSMNIHLTSEEHAQKVKVKLQFKKRRIM